MLSVRHAWSFSPLNVKLFRFSLNTGLKFYKVLSNPELLSQMEQALNMVGLDSKYIKEASAGDCSGHILRWFGRM